MHCRILRACVWLAYSKHSKKMFVHLGNLRAWISVCSIFVWICEFHLFFSFISKTEFISMC